MHFRILNGKVVMTERRRGADLEHALLEAAWAELTNIGYAGLASATSSRGFSSGSLPWRAATSLGLS
jgi:hypothetical protein